MSLGPNQRHLLDQLMAFNLEVQGKLRTFQDDLVRMGYSEPEAWSIARSLEERILGPVVDGASRALPVEETLDAIIARKLEEMGGGSP